MPKKTIRQALRDALFYEMRRDPTVIVLGEDIVGGTGCEGEIDSWGGPFGITRGLIAEFGPERVRDAPISESAIIGAAAGAALTGLRPVAELMFADFFGVCFDQLYNQAAKFRFMFGGKARTPMVVRMTYGAGSRSASQHSQAPHAVFTHVPGLKVVMPTNAYDAKGLLLQAIRDDDPVIFMEHKKLYDLEDEVPDEPYTIPFGEANIVHEGDDVTIVAFPFPLSAPIELVAMADGRLLQPVSLPGGGAVDPAEGLTLWTLAESGDDGAARRLAWAGSASLRTRDPFVWALVGANARVTCSEGLVAHAPQGHPAPRGILFRRLGQDRGGTWRPGTGRRFDHRWLSQACDPESASGPRGRRCCRPLSLAGPIRR